MNAKYRVDLIESERGWGQRVDESRYFDTQVEARLFKARFNTKNDLPYVPDWYMYATEPVLVDLDAESK